MHLTAELSDISRCSVHDGPGVRTVVYFKGCALRCAWCHNPETLSHRPTLMHLQTKCIGCQRCVELCPVHAAKDGIHTISHELCRGCGACADACPSGALHLVGETVTVEELLGRILKDKHYYDASGGGVTLSGGECLLQAEFCEMLLRECRAHGIHTAIESALHVTYESIERVLPYADLFFADLKLATPERHHDYTGQSNARILENLLRLSHTDAHLVVRIPIIPSVNDTPREQRAIAEVLMTLGEAVREVELLKYNPLAEGKYRAVGASYTSFSREGQTDEQMETLRDTLSRAIGARFPVTFRR